jgi:hypothetical protein
MSNPIFNPQTGNIDICAVARLVDSESKYEEVFEIMYQPRGAFEFMNSWTSRNDIVANYIVKGDLVDQVNSELMQKDCVNPIEDTDITYGIEHWEWDQIYEYVVFRSTLDPETVRESVIFNEATSTIEVCHVVWLGSNPKRDKQIIKVPVPKPGTFAGLFGDPHIVTFDGLQYDCQGKQNQHLS